MEAGKLGCFPSWYQSGTHFHRARIRIEQKEQPDSMSRPVSWRSALSIWPSILKLLWGPRTSDKNQVCKHTDLYFTSEPSFYLSCGLFGMPGHSVSSDTFLEMELQSPNLLLGFLYIQTRCRIFSPTLLNISHQPSSVFKFHLHYFKVSHVLDKHEWIFPLAFHRGFSFKSTTNILF